MRIDATHDGIIRLRDAFKSVIFENAEGEQIRVRVVNGGFEILHKENVTITEKIIED